MKFNRAELEASALECCVPPHLVDGLLDYIVDGVPTGGFLAAVLENNFMEAFGRADFKSSFGMKNLAAFIYNHAPSDCHGNPARVAAWIARHQKTEVAQGEEHGNRN